MISIEEEEKEERKLRALESQANKAQKLLEQGDNTGEKRQWFQTGKQRNEAIGKEN